MQVLAWKDLQNEFTNVIVSRTIYNVSDLTQMHLKNILNYFLLITIFLLR